MVSFPAGGDRNMVRAMEVGMLVARNQERTHYSRQLMRLATALHDQGRLDAAAVLRAAATFIDGTAEYEEVLDIITNTHFTKAIDDL